MTVCTYALTPTTVALPAVAIPFVHADVCLVVMMLLTGRAVIPHWRSHTPRMRTLHTLAQPGPAEVFRPLALHCISSTLHCGAAASAMVLLMRPESIHRKAARPAGASPRPEAHPECHSGRQALAPVTCMHGAC